MPAPDNTMDTLDGFLLVPPDRSQILGRASWKTRYVLVGRKTPVLRDNGTNANYGHRTLTKSMPKPISDDYYVSVYKHKDDYEPIQQWSTALVTDCQVQTVAHRKQAVAMPTLVITLSDKDRKRRSSRAAGLVSTNKDSGATTLWFRAAPEEKQHSLDDWARFILSKRSTSNAESPVSPVFTSPFATRSRDAPEYLQRPGSSGNRLQHKSSTATYSTGRERPVTFSSESPSLRSKRSDLSSPSVTNNNHHIPGQLYTTVLPTDIGPSGEYAGDSREGYRSGSAQGRSAVNSPAFVRDSISSHGQYGEVADVNAPPAPGETILDRAFKLGHVPFAGPDVPGQEKLSSIARFDALMREAEQRRKQKEAAEKRQRMAMQSSFDADDSSEEATTDASGDTDTGDDTYPSDGPKTTLISPSAQRALAFIAGRHNGQPASGSGHRPSASRNHLSFHADSVPATVTAAPMRPHTAHAKSRPGAQRTQSTPHLVASPATYDIPNLPTKVHEEPRRAAEKRASGSSSKRLSLNDITKRFSSTSSLLLVQTNASGASSRRSSEVDAGSSAPRTNLSVRGNGRGQEQKCGWRGSVNVVSSEGGFV